MLEEVLRKFEKALLMLNDLATKQKYDISDVDLKTGKGMQTKFFSFEEMDAYFDASNDEGEKDGIE